MRLCGICQNKCKSEFCSECTARMLKNRKEIEIRKAKAKEESK